MSLVFAFSVSFHGIDSAISPVVAAVWFFVSGTIWHFYATFIDVYF